jgi:hypothetical protein
MPFSALQEKDYIGRQEELAALTKRVTVPQGDTAQSAVLSGPRGMGKTELLKQLFGRLFWRQKRVAPFYYTVNAALLSAEAFSRSYLTRFLCQRLAYQKKEQALLYLDGISLADASSLLEERGETWASEILSQYERSSGDPLDALRIALNAPYLSAMATGTSVVVLIDEFHRLKGLHRGGVPEPQLAALFEEPMSSGKTPHIITGNAPELQERVGADIPPVARTRKHVIESSGAPEHTGVRRECTSPVAAPSWRQPLLPEVCHQGGLRKANT